MEVDSAPTEPSEWEIKERARLERADRRKTTGVPLNLVSVGSGVDEHMQHEDLWFDDGNVVLIARNVWFKLYRGLLARFSSVFRDMFQVADASAGDYIQGCPVVQVTDNPEHLVLLFTLLYDGARHPFFLNPLYYMEFQDLRGIALVCFKYDVLHIQAEVVRRLQVCFPATLEQWDLRYPKSCSAKPTDPKPEDTLNIHPIDSIAVVNLARRFNMTEILPTALYICAMQKPEDIMAQVRYGDNGSQDVEELLREDLARCLRSRCENQSLPLVYPSSAFASGIMRDACAYLDNRACEKAWSSICCEFMVSKLYGSPDLFYNVSHWIDEQQPNYPLCTACLAKMRKVDAKYREGVWARQKTYFGL